MYLVTSPDNVLLGARETLKEAGEIARAHALRPREGGPTDRELLVLADPARWQDLLSSYKIERVK